MPVWVGVAGPSAPNGAAGLSSYPAATSKRPPSTVQLGRRLFLATGFNLGGHPRLESEDLALHGRERYSLAVRTSPDGGYPNAQNEREFIRRETVLRLPRLTGLNQAHRVTVRLGRDDLIRGRGNFETHVKRGDLSAVSYRQRQLMFAAVKRRPLDGQGRSVNQTVDLLGHLVGSPCLRRRLGT